MSPQEEINAFETARLALLADDFGQKSLANSFSWPRLKQFNWGLDFFDRFALNNHSDALWIVGQEASEKKVSYAQLSQTSNQVANLFARSGMHAGDRLLVMLDNVEALWQTFLAAIKAQVVLVPTSTLLTPEELKDRIERGGVKHVITTPEYVPRFAAFDQLRCKFLVGIGAYPDWIPFELFANEATHYQPCQPTAADSMLLLYFTSGTTSRPKIVVHTHQSYPIGHLSTMYWLGLKPGDVHLNISSPGWAKHAWSNFFAPFNAGACIFISQMPRFSAPELLDLLTKYPVTSLCAPATVWRMLALHDLSRFKPALRLRSLAGAGEPINPNLIEIVQNAWGLKLRDGYGQTETTALIGHSPKVPLVLGSMGVPLPGYKITLRDADGTQCREGEICVQLDEDPLGLMKGYLSDDGLISDHRKQQFYRTGDIASIDANGYFHFIGRADDVFKSSDYRISPFELESVLMEHPFVAEVAVVPSPDPIKLSVPKAFIALSNDIPADAQTAHELFFFCSSRVAGFKRIRRIQFVSEFPKTISGKIRRVQLRRMELDAVREADGHLDGEYRS